MTRASLLHILNHVGGISEAEIRELEQLAAAFPYCQTAHVLLAKAAHDQGSMLASQRLRRAATYAVDRQLLRQLLEQPVPAEVVPPRELVAAVSTASSSTAFLQTLVTEDVQALESQEDNGVTLAEEISLEAEVAPISGPEPEATVQLQQETAPVADTQSEPPEAEVEAQPLNLPKAPANLLDSLEANNVAQSPTSIEPGEPAAVLPTETAPASSAVAPVLPSPNPDEVLPALAPPIRPPADAGISRFEFGLNETKPQLVPILYQLPGIDEEEDAPPGSEAVSLPTSAATAIAPLFRADPDLGYGLLPEGSRCGYALQLRDQELTCSLPVTEFFPPDALLHAHSRQQPSAMAPSSLDLINRFLKVQPRLKSPAVLPAVQEQADLAARNTLDQPALASESLAKILVKQGKPERAIKIYEQLMVRQPEKSTYFADQIQQLKTSE